MTKRACCCGGAPTPPDVSGSFCCNPLFFTDFITLYGDDMADHAEVSPYDWIGLAVFRPGLGTADYIRSNRPNISCNCCCSGCDPVSPITKNPKTSGSKFRPLFDKFSNLIQTKKSDQNYKFKKVKKIKAEDSLLPYRPKDENSEFVENIVNKGVTGDIDSFGFLNTGNSPVAGGIDGTDTVFDSVPCYKDVFVWLEGIEDDPAHDICEKSCCKSEIWQTAVEGSDPIFFAYKYSGCNIIWYPREFTFDKDPYVSQCTGFKTWQRRCNSVYDPNCDYVEAQNSCSGYSQQRFGAGSAGSQNFVDECSYQGYPERQTSINFPCACVPFPHIHGGVEDSVFNNINVRLSEGSLGYASKMYPFSEPMSGEYEAGCCWCANTAYPPPTLWIDYAKARNACSRSTHPFFDGRGKRPETVSPCGLGLRCHYIAPDGVGGNQNFYLGNPYYKRHCYEWGISPYLLRISTKYNKTGLEIFKHGRNGGYKHDFGVVFEATKVEKNELFRDIEINFVRRTGKRSSLREQYIGFVQLEHHFECYAFRSPEGLQTIEMQALLNNCVMIVAPFERGYGGTYTPLPGNCSEVYRWNPWKYDSILWQVKRGIPRRVMYAGSGVPIFHFDLIAMENLCRNDASVGANCLPFRPETFLEHYYRYFFGMISWSGKGCQEFYRPPEPQEWDFTHLTDSYYYVKCWIEQMIVHGILRIKDHSIDIAQETNNIIATGVNVTNETTGENEILLPDSVAIECGGISGYKDLLNFWGVSAGTPDFITPKLVKQKLLNPNSKSLPDKTPSGWINGSKDMRLFLPRRARLPLGSISSGITAWGCTGGFSAQNNYEGITCPSYVGPNNPNGSNYGDSLFIPEILNSPSPEGPLGVYSILKPSDVYTNLAGTILRDISKKISIFGGIPYGEYENDPITSGDRSCGPPEDIFTGIFGMYPSSIACIPTYLSTTTLFSSEQNDSGESVVVPANQLDVYDGTVRDLCFTHKFAVALCDFDRQAFGYPCYRPNNPGELPTNPAYEAAEFSPLFALYNDYNCNGANSTFAIVSSPTSPVCLTNEPFHWIETAAGPQPGPRAAVPDPPFRGTRLKSWGSWSALIGTFSMAVEDAYLYGSDVANGNNPEKGVRRRCYDPNIHGFDEETKTYKNYRYPGTNTWNIWTKIGCGLYHFAALDDHGGLFITPNSSNSENQASHGIPLQYDSRWNRISFGWSYENFGPFFNYYNHIPRPGFIKEEEWSQLTYNTLTAYSSTYRQRGHCKCAPFIADYGDVPSYCNVNIGPPSGGGSAPTGCVDCYQQYITVPAIDPGTGVYGCGNCFGIPPWKDMSCYLMGSYVQGAGQPSSEAYTFAFRQSQPHYKDLTCGAFNTMLLTNENKIEMYGTFLQINENGTVIGPKINEIQDGVEVPVLQPIPCFVPADVQALCGTWDVNYACPLYCQSLFTPEGAKDYEGKLLEPCWSGLTLSPIIGATYSPPSYEKRIKIIKSSADYALCITNDNKVYVWGEISMVPNAYNKNNYIPGTPASTVLNETHLGVPLGSNIEITNVATGIHAFYIAFKVFIPNTSFTVNKVYSYSRYGNETFGLKFPDSIQNKEIISIGAGNGFGIAIYGDGSEPKTWDALSFAKEDRVDDWKLNHLDYQYKNFSSIPKYHQRDAFFHAIPGNWDFSKWLYGGNCCNAIENPDHPCLQEDTCSALAYNIYLDPSAYGVEYKAISNSYLKVKPNRPDDPLVGPGMTLVDMNVIQSTSGFTTGQLLYASARISPTGNTLSFEGRVVDYKSHTYDSDYTLSLYVTDVAWTPTASGEWIESLNSTGGQSENDLWDIELNRFKLFNRNLSRSGHPELLWMRQDIRRLTEQAFDQLKNVLPPPQLGGPVGGLACVPAGVADVSYDDAGGFSSLYGSCLGDLGPCWAESRPSARNVTNSLASPFPSCDPGTECDPTLIRKNRGIVCEDTGCNILASGFIVPTPQAYRADKDVFQKVYHRYGPVQLGGNFCRTHNSKSQSYFKYAERHYYLGHDEEKDTWEIYETPDILRNINPNSIEGVTSWITGIIGGLTGATVAYPPNNGFGQGNSGITALKDYPGSGPNYYRQDWVLYPSFFISYEPIASTIASNICAIEDPDQACSAPCLPPGFLARNKVFNILRFGGVGAYVWGANCLGPATTYCDTGDCNKMWNRYISWTQMFKTLTPTEILWGVKNDIDPIKPPDEDPNYEKTGFLKVLTNPQYTAMYEPYRDESSRWHPMCWESASDYPTLNIRNGDVTCFVGTSDTDPAITCLNGDPNSVRLDSQFNGYSRSAFCYLYECCPPPPP